MSTPISPTSLPTQLLDLTGSSSKLQPTSQSGDFQQLLLNLLGNTTDLQNQSQQAIESQMLGGDITQVEVLSAVKKADLALRLMMQIRNKVLEAYNEVQQIRM